MKKQKDFFEMICPGEGSLRKVYDGWELYDLKNDPDEMQNVYADKNYEKIVLKLKDKLVELQTEYKDLDRSTY